VTAHDVLDILRQKGPQTGWELLEQTGLEALPLWQACVRTSQLRSECIGRRYVRLDRTVEGYARLSPSIRREFLTYTILGLEEQQAGLEARAQQLRKEISRISRNKRDVAKNAIADTVPSLAEWGSISERVCFIIAGDIVYDMAHAVPRPEISTGRMVQGSDLDIIVIAEDSVPQEALNALDAAILKRKYLLLIQPNYQEEIDYIVKHMAKVRQQLQFDSFRHMIASKIIHEGEFLYGSEAVFRQAKALVAEFGIPEKLARLEQRAAADRVEAEKRLLQSDAAAIDSASLNLFYTHEEGDEIY
jgi:hypothetical protein